MVSREYACVAVVALLVITGGSVSYVGGQPNATTAADGEAAGPVVEELLTQFADGDAADNVYVDGSGDAVFRYENGSEDVAAAIPLQGELGMEAGPGLVHALYAGDLASGPLRDRNATGNATLRATPDSATSTGELVVDRGDVEALSADLRRTHTADAASSSLEVTATVGDETRLYETVETEGTVRTTATTVSASGTVRTSVPDGSPADEGPIALDERRTVTVTETDGAIRLEASERRTVGEWERDRWASAADARTSLENRYDEIAIALGGEASLTLESYAYDEGGDRETVELEYAVAFTDVKDGLAERLTDELRASAGVELDDHERRVIADRLATVSIEEVSVSAVQRGLETDLEWSAELRGTDALALGVVEIAGSNDRIADAWGDRYDAVRTDLEARREAGLVRETAWNASIEHDRAAGRTTIDVVADSTAENWREYGDQREARGLGPIPRTTATATAERVGDGLEAGYEYETDGDGNGPAAFDQLLRVANGEFGPVLDVAVAPLSDAAFEVARVDAVVDDGTAELESAAALENVTALGPVPGTDADVTALHAVTTDERTSVYVTTAGRFGSDPTADVIRDDPRVGPATDVHEPGEWDRDLPALESADVRAFLGVDGETAADSAGHSAGDSSITGPIAGLILLAVAFAAGRRWAPWRRALGGRREP